ncbi:conserved Plasmodium protein, unknown function [Plasmodium knowlesi strain H]|uniref:Uncharacterized protein n=3 Tax=Plasmodium knowlesi TaxID=5850 RepID=A0A5K1URK7_PLAKH|nr:conserved Plasmodium protein, unknown function [Plasmodium knowlesi strain H]OTN65179.1 Uncharacterized protein PKNOH_S120163800 [Plasmodium knowlesi]CAA9988494.1 conserved Plasmodium protein, unknown function [Plasmodium knowlesi strain H]SBO19709.1 conserved Plasmodium protein, unknown function [Plasmodium knowlesi strain H]SBO20500.1 conserved Plasmodium protein, unknown function [Plasmodium knowlesi strain H]VVS77968.1 conserved Plasmodium protein, unknown function [Plasmodium knowlesi |eukprot:XP_002259473.1 hypothetical protein, conserved in Plasmodium species [Plasmodium knowlesi strain H]
MNLESSHKILTHTPNGASANSSCKGMNHHVLKGDYTNEIKKKEIRNKQVGNTNKNEKNCNIKNTDTHFEKDEGDKHVEEKKSIPSDLQGIDKLTCGSKKGIPFCMGTKDVTSCFSHCEGYPHGNYKEDSVTLECAEACETEGCTDNSGADGGANCDSSRGSKTGQERILRGEAEKVEKITQRDTLKGGVEQNDVLPEIGLGKHDPSRNVIGVESKASAPKESTKRCSSRESIKDGKETDTPSIKNDKNLMKEKCRKIKESQGKVNNDNLEIKCEHNSSRRIHTSDGGNWCNKNCSVVSTGKWIDEILEDEKEEHQMEKSASDKGNVKKSKRKYSQENIIRKVEIGLHEKGNIRKKIKDSHMEDGDDITKEKGEGNDKGGHEEKHISGKSIKAENAKKEPAGSELDLEKEEIESHSRDATTAESISQACAYKKEKIDDDKTYNVSGGKEVAMKGRSVSKEEGNEDTLKIINPTDEGQPKKKYARLLKSLQINLSKKKIEQGGEKRIKTWGEKLTLQEKINQFIKNKIATRTEYKYGKKPNTLSICNQFNLYNHLTMLNDFNRLHYYRAAMRWTGHKDIYACENDPLMAHYGKGENSSNHVIITDNTTKEKNTTMLAEEEICQFNGENVSTVGNTISMYDEEVVGMLEDQNGGKNPYIFFENNKECYVYNKNIIEIGTGPLSLLSINAILNGAKHVDALEVNKDASEMAKKLIEGYNLEDFIKIINCYSKMYVYKGEDGQRRVKRRSSFYNYFDSNTDEQECSNFNYDLIISEVIGDFASQEGVADIYLDLHKKIFSYRKYQEYLHNWRMEDGGDSWDSDRNALRNHRTKASDEEEGPIDYEESGKNEQASEQRGQEISKKRKKISYSEFAADDKLYCCKEFYEMNVKSIPYSVTTYYCPVKFPYYDNIIYKSENYPERTIISPKSKLLQSVMLEWSNLSLTEDQNENNDFGTLEYLYLEQNVANQMIQRRNHIFSIQRNGPFCGFLITIDVEIRKGEHFGTKYGTCDSWYTNIVLLKDEINVNKDDLVISKTYTNLLNYNENIIDRKVVLVSRPSYTFYGYILKSIGQDTFSESTSDSDGDVNNNCFQNSDSEDYQSNGSSYIYLDDGTILLLDEMTFHEKVLTRRVRQNDGKDVTVGETEREDNSESVKGEEVKTSEKNKRMKGNKLNSSDKQMEGNVEGHSDVAHGLAENHCGNRGVDQVKGTTQGRSAGNTSHIDMRNRTARGGEGTGGSALSRGRRKIGSHRDALVNKREKGKGANLGEESYMKGDIPSRDEQIKKEDYSPRSKQNEGSKSIKGEKANLGTVEKENTASSSGGNINNPNSTPNRAQSMPKEGAKDQANGKKKKDNIRGGNKYRKLSNESREEYEKDIAGIINNYNSNAKFYYENLKDKILVYRNTKYKLLHIYEPVVIDYDEQATVIYKKDDIYNSRENNMSMFVNNVYH